jgi:hypothetical protein
MPQDACEMIVDHGPISSADDSASLPGAAFRHSQLISEDLIQTLPRRSNL